MMGDPLFDWLFPKWSEPTTSRAAAGKVAQFTAGMRAQVYGYVRSMGTYGATCDEAEVALGMIHQTCSARFNDLEEMGLVLRTERQRRTRRGYWASVYVVTQQVMQGNEEESDPLSGEN